MGTSINAEFGHITALRGTRNLAVYCILSRLLRSVRLWRMNNALERIYSTDMPFTGKLHPKLCIYRSAIMFSYLAIDYQVPVNVQGYRYHATLPDDECH
jgi:hypothetical protein